MTEKEAAEGTATASAAVVVVTAPTQTQEDPTGTYISMI